MLETDGDRLAILTSLGGRPYTTSRGALVGLFEDEYQAVDGASVDIDGSMPRLHARVSDVNRIGLQPNDSIVVGSATYQVRTVQPGFDGIAVVMLEIVS